MKTTLVNIICWLSCLYVLSLAHKYKDSEDDDERSYYHYGKEKEGCDCHCDCAPNIKISEGCCEDDDNRIMMKPRARTTMEPRPTTTMEQPTTTKDPCPRNLSLEDSGWLMFECRYYKPFNCDPQLCSWDGSQNHCRSMSANLATAYSTDTSKFFLNITDHWVMLGGNDKAEEGTWVWLDGSPVPMNGGDYYWFRHPTNASLDEPNNDESGLEAHCMIMGRSWEDRSCDTSGSPRSYVCEWVDEN